MTRLRRVVLERLIRYYRYLAERTARQTVDTVTSGQLGEALDVDPSQVRKDFAAIGLSGVSRVGYDVCEVCRTIRTVVGFDETYAAVLAGTGQLGGAIMSYPGFERYGLRIVAAFDADPETIGTEKGGLTVRSVHELREFIEEHQIPVLILTTPVDVAQKLAELGVMAGVRAVWNFTPTRLKLPDSILVRNEHISIGLAEISFHLHSNDVPRGGLRDTIEADAPVCCDDAPPPPAGETAPSAG